MSTEKDDAKEKSAKAEKDETKKKAKTTEKEKVLKKSGSDEKSEAQKKPERAEKRKAEKKPEDATKVQTKEKPLEKMTVKELRELAKEMPEISGVHGMKKDELIVAIKKARGIEDEPVKKSDAGVRELKRKIKVLKAERKAALAASDKKLATIYKRRISRLKKKSRRAAA